MAGMGPLHGVRVLDCSGWFGVLGARLLADAGADVVRVPPPQRDFLGAGPPRRGASGHSIQDAGYNAGKRSVAIDLADDHGLRRFRELVAGSDILCEEWSPGGAP